MSKLTDAAKAGDTAEVKRLLDAGSRHMKTDSNGNTALMLAAWHGHTDVVTALLVHDQSAEHINHHIPWYISTWNVTALIRAAKSGHTDIVRALLAAGADVNHKTCWGDTALMFAAMSGHTDIVRALLAIDPSKAHINHATGFGETALLCAAKNHDTETTETLLAADNIEVNHKTRLGDTALVYAAYLGHTEIVRALLAKNSSNEYINHATGTHTHACFCGNDHDTSSNCSGSTALIYAASNGRTETVQALLAEDGIDVNHASAWGYTALTKAGENGHTEIIKALLAAGADVNPAGEYGYTALIWAAMRGHTEIVTALLAVEGIDVNHPDQWGNTALIKAANRGHTEIVQALLVVQGIDVNHPGRHSNTALIRAAEKGHTEIVQALLAIDPSKEQVNHANSGGYTALIRAVKKRNTATVTRLCEHKQQLFSAELNARLQESPGTAALTEEQALLLNATLRDMDQIMLETHVFPKVTQEHYQLMIDAAAMRVIPRHLFKTEPLRMLAKMCANEQKKMDAHDPGVPLSPGMSIN